MFSRTLSLFVLCFLASSVLAQKNPIDSLENRLKEKLAAYERVAVLSELCWEYRRVDQGKALSYGKEAVALAEKNSNQAGLSKALNDLSIIYIDKTELDSAIGLLNRALVIRKELKDTIGQAAVYNKLGIIYQTRLDLRAALDNALNALKLFEQLNMQPHVRTTLNNIGIIHYNLHNYDKSLEIHSNLLKLRTEANDAYGIGQTLVNLGNVYGARGDTAQAVTAYAKASDAFRKLNKQEELAVTLNNLAAYNNALGRYAESQKAITEGLAIRRALNNPKEIASALIMLGELKAKTRKPAEAIKALNEAVSISKQHALPLERACYQKLAALYKTLDNADSVFHYYYLYETMNTALYEANIKNEVTELQTKYETEKKEQAIVALSNENTIQQLQLSRQKIYFGSGVVIVILLGLFAWQAQRSKRLKEKIAAEQQLKLEQDKAARAVIQTEMNERRRLAGELHDGVIQTFVAARFNLSAIKPSLNIEENSANYGNALRLLDEGCSELRTVSHTMMPESLIKKGLVDALHDLVARIDQRVISIQLDIAGKENRPDQTIEASVYRIVQECISNTLKHAKASRLDIQLNMEEEQLELSIEDNGVGFDPKTKNTAAGIGMQSMQSRVNLLAGHFEISSQPGRGTSISVSLPLHTHLEVRGKEVRS